MEMLRYGQKRIIIVDFKRVVTLDLTVRDLSKMAFHTIMNEFHLR